MCLLKAMKTRPSQKSCQDDFGLGKFVKKTSEPRFVWIFFYDTYDYRNTLPRIIIPIYIVIRFIHAQVITSVMVSVSLHLFIHIYTTSARKIINNNRYIHVQFIKYSSTPTKNYSTWLQFAKTENYHCLHKQHYRISHSLRRFIGLNLKLQLQFLCTYMYMYFHFHLR